jgi:SAM-dependent methyltransferase
MYSDCQTMNTVKDHYDRQLAPVYSWIAGDSEVVIKRNYEFLCQLGINSIPPGLAIDLGAGSGFQSIPLAQLGFSVIAVDFCASLLSEWGDRAQELSIQIVHDDILNFYQYVVEPAQVIVCMGDTLTHLNSLGAVRSILVDSDRALANRGKLILTFRDYVTIEPQGTKRFIPVQSDGSTILTCFLEYHQELVEVYDLLYHKEDDRWVLTTSSYPKLRLDPNWVCNQIEEIGLQVIHHEILKGMICIIAQKP